MSETDFPDQGQTPGRFPWYLLTGLLLGLGLGLLISLVISPVRFSDTSPAALTDEFKSSYRLIIAQAYQANPDPLRASQRLALLGDPSVQDSLTAQAQQALTAGDEPTARSLAELAGAIASMVSATSEANALPSQVQPTATNLPASPQAASTQPAFTRTPPPPYLLLEQHPVCDADRQPGLLIVEVFDAAGDPVPGVQINIAWDGGLDSFFTGLKPSISAGYADFHMTDGVSYSLRAGNSEAVSNLSIPACEDGDHGGLRLVFGP